MSDADYNAFAESIQEKNDRIRELEKENVKASQAFAEQRVKDVNRILELEAELENRQGRKCEKCGQLKASTHICASDFIRLQNALRKLEWYGKLRGTMLQPRLICPVCENQKPDGHRRNCWLKAALEAK